MNSPARRFSLTKILGGAKAQPTPAEESKTSVSEEATLTHGSPPVAPGGPKAESLEVSPASPARVALEEPKRAHAITRDRRPATAGKAPKKKRSYTVDMRLCDDLEILAWYHDRSTSSIVEDLIRKHLSKNRALLEKAQEMRRMR